MSIVVQDFRERTHVVAIGVSQYKDEAFRVLPSSSAAATALGSAFKETGIPDANICVAITPHDTTNAAIRLLLATCASRVSQDGVLIVFFSGHGTSTGTGSFILGSDTVHGNDSNGISAQELGTILETTAASGVLLLIDSCYGAGIAEDAPAFFRKLGKGRFRIILSSSRANQESHQPADGTLSPFCAHLRAVVSGQEKMRERSGEVRFADLAKHLQTSVDEDIRREGFPSQEPISVGVHGPDPLLFVAGTANPRARVAETRYTWRYIREQLRIYGTVTVSAFLVIASVWYVWLDKTQYIDLAPGNRTMIILQGYPGLNVPPLFPRVVWEFDDQFGAVAKLVDELRLKHGNRLISRLGESVIPKVLDAVGPVERAWLLSDMGDSGKGRAVLLDLYKKYPLDEARRNGLDLIAAYATDQDLGLMRELSNEGVFNASIFLARYEPAFMKGIALSDRRAGWAGMGLNRLEPPCSDSAREYLKTYLMQQAIRLEEAMALLDSAARLRCSLPEDQIRIVLDVLSKGGANDILGAPLANELLLTGNNNWRTVITDWARQSTAHADSALLVLRWLPGTCVSIKSLTPTRHDLQSELITVKCPPGSAGASSLPKLLPEAILAAQASGSLDKSEAARRLLALITHSRLPMDWELAVDGLQKMGVNETVPSLLSLINSSNQGDWNFAAMIAIVDLLWKLDPQKAATAVPTFNFPSDAVLLHEQHLLKFRPRETVKQFLTEFGHQSLGHQAMLLASTPLIPDELDRIRQIWEHGNSIEKDRALGILATLGTVDEVARLLIAPEPHFRQVVSAFVAAHPDFDLVIERALSLNRFPNSALRYAMDQKWFRDDFQKDIRTTPTELQSWRRDMIRSRLQTPALSPYSNVGISIYVNNFPIASGGAK